MGTGQSTLLRKESLRRRRSKHAPRRSSSLGVPSSDGLEALERPLEVQEALFDRRLLHKRKRKWLETAFSWDKCSENMKINPEDPTKCQRFPVAQRTDLCRGKLLMEHGLHLWKFTWPADQRGTHAVIGVCNDSLPFVSRGYTHLVGSSKASWGWDLARRGLYHNGKRSNYDYPSQVNLSEVPNVIVMILDMDAGTLAFEVNSRYMGIAFTGLKGQKLYAAASVVWGNCEVEMKYLGFQEPGEVKPLVALARNTIRRAIGARRLADGCVDQLSIPDILKLYVLCQLPRQYATVDDERLDIDNNVASWKAIAAGGAACASNDVTTAADSFTTAEVHHADFEEENDVEESGADGEDFLYGEGYVERDIWTREQAEALSIEDDEMQIPVPVRESVSRELPEIKCLTTPHGRKEQAQSRVTDNSHLPWIPVHMHHQKGPHQSKHTQPTSRCRGFSDSVHDRKHQPFSSTQQPVNTM